MRPSAQESLNALRLGLAEVIAPELQSAFAQDTANVLQMLIESLSAEWDTAADDLARDNETLAQLLTHMREALAADGNDDASSAVNLIDDALASPDAGSLAISALYERNRVLRGALEKALEVVEDRAGGPDAEAIAHMRSAAYAHLREVAARGWSFWDVASFREYVARLRAQHG